MLTQILAHFFGSAGGRDLEFLTALFDPFAEFEFDGDAAVDDLLKVEVGRGEDVVRRIVFVGMEQRENAGDVDDLVAGIFVDGIVMPHACQMQFLEEALVRFHAADGPDRRRIAHAEDIADRFPGFRGGQCYGDFSHWFSPFLLAVY